MTTRIQKEYVDTGFGFPVHLMNVPMVRVRGTWAPRINHKHLAEAVLRALVHKPARWTGNELRFVRLQLGMTLVELAETFYVTHPAVVKWEKHGNQPTRMMWATEKDVRLHVHLKMEMEGDLREVYRELRLEPSWRRRRTRIDVTEEGGVLV
jgi:hypothetical protein